MPFDTAAYKPEIDFPAITGNTLAAIGISPVPREVAENHKTKVIQQFRAEGQESAHLVNSGLALWLTRQLAIDDDGNVFHEPDFRAIRRQLTPGWPWTSTRRGAPAEIVQVAETVHHGIEQAKFSLEFFYTDPILNVTYTDTNNRVHHDCLGIWDQGKVVAIAQTSGPAPSPAPSSPAAPWYLRLFGL